MYIYIYHICNDNYVAFNTETFWGEYNNFRSSFPDNSKKILVLTLAKKHQIVEEFPSRLFKIETKSRNLTHSGLIAVWLLSAGGRKCCSDWIP